MNRRYSSVPEKEVKRSRFHLLILVVLSSAIGCGERDYTEGYDPESDVEPLQVIALGDSITAMEGYVDVLQEELSDDDIWRAARAGYTTRHWIPSWGYYERHNFKTLRPRVVVLLLGTNDARTSYHIPVDEYIDNIATITEALLDDGVGQVILMSPPQVFTRRPAPETVQRLEQYSLALAWYCFPPDDNIECGPDLHATLEASDFDDGVHPNAAGHERIADALLPYLVLEN